MRERKSHRKPVPKAGDQILIGKKPGYPIGVIPRPWLWVNGLLAILFLSAALFIANAEYSRKESVRGWLVSRSGVVRVANIQLPSSAK